MRPYGPLRGRDDELAAALRVVRRTHDHRASGVVLISGDPGIGKTALLSEIARQAAQMHITEEEEQRRVRGAIIGAALLSDQRPYMYAAYCS